MKTGLDLEPVNIAPPGLRVGGNGVMDVPREIKFGSRAADRWCDHLSQNNIPVAD